MTSGTLAGSLWISAGGAAGLAAAPVLADQVARLSVRSGEPEQTSCLACAATLPGPPALHCGHCGTWIGAPMAIETAAVAVTALLFARIGIHPAVAAFAFLGVTGVALAQIDLAVQRLPDRLTLAGYPALLVLLALAAAVTGSWTAFGRALLGGMALGVSYLVLALISSGQLGGGDVKLAGLIGLALGWAGWRTLIAGAILGFLLAAVIGLAGLVVRRISRHSMISFGPFMLAGAMLAVLATSW
jgi:leader peptidase (prepilin peptidase) / N-methyltransferase